MWCPNCKVKSPTVAVGNDDLICAQCNSEIVPTVPKPKSRAVRTAASKKKATNNSNANTRRPNSKDAKSDSIAQPEVKFVSPTQEQTVESAQAVAKAWSDSNRKWRSDKAHLIGKVEQPRDEVSESVTAAEAQNDPATKVLGYHLVLFGVFVFLVGHGLTLWAFLAGHFGAWAIGSFCSVGGVTIAFVSIVQALRDLQSQIGQAKPNPKRSVKKLRRVKRKRSAQR
jgi:predicted lipid-binding transport protein (Tim44 family)